MKLCAFTLDLEADYGGVLNQYEIFKDPKKIDELLAALNAENINITVFTVGEIFDLYPHIIEIFEQYNCEFEVHSHSHDFTNPDTEEEIEKSKAAYYRYFNKYPRGYRAPRGIISDGGIKLLEKHGFVYDSSIFPSYFPNPFKYLLIDRNVHYIGSSNIVEIPFTTISPLRLTLSASYLKLFGVDFFIKLSQLSRPSSIICFDSHLHDFIVTEKSYKKLPLFWKAIYGRNKFNGTEYSLRYLNYIKKQGYKFCYMSEIYNMFKRGQSHETG